MNRSLSTIVVLAFLAIVVTLLLGFWAAINGGSGYLLVSTLIIVWLIGVVAWHAIQIVGLRSVLEQDKITREAERSSLQLKEAEDFRKRKALISVMEDLRLEVSQRKELEHRLRRTQFVVDEAKDVVLIVKRDGTLDYANEQATTLFGYSNHELLKLTPSDLDDSGRINQWEAYWHTLFSLDNQIYESKHRRKDGTLIDCQVHSSILQFEGESLVVLFIRDVTALKRAESFRATLFELSTNPHLILSEHGILDCNKAATEILGIKDKASLMEQSPDKFSPSNQPDGRRSDEKYKEMHAIAYREGYHRFEWIHQTINGEPLPCDVTLTPVSHRDGRTLLAVWQDLRERKLAEAKLRKHAEELEAANRDLEEFSYIASHDLRSPLRGIGQLAKFVREDDADKLSQDSVNHLDLLNKRILRMQKLLDDLLTYSRIGREEDQLEEINLSELVQEMIDLLAIDPAYEVKVVDELPVVISYATPLRMLLLNLIGNAVKHHDGERGIIEIGFEELKTEYRFRVTDDGPGIDPAFHERIFKIFQTLQSRDTVEASGMGLAIVEKTLLRFGGRVELLSELGSGTTIQFTWPKSVQTMAGVDTGVGGNENRP